MHYIRGLEFCIWDYDTLLRKKRERERETCAGNKKNASFLFAFFFFQFSMHVGEARMGEMAKFNGQKHRKLKAQIKELYSEFTNYLSIITGYL